MSKSNLKIKLLDYPEIELVEKPYRKYVLPNNVKIKYSVTGVICGRDKPDGLVQWNVNNVLEYLQSNMNDYEGARYYNKRLLKTYGAFGTQLHDMIEKWIRGESHGYPIVGPAMTVAYMKAQKWLESQDIESVFGIEQPMYWLDPIPLAGTFDLGYFLKGGEPILVDYKTSSSISSKMHLQIAAYARFLLLTFGLEVKRGHILQFDRNTGDLTVHDVNFVQRLIKIFERELELHKEYKGLEAYMNTLEGEKI